MQERKQLCVVFRRLLFGGGSVMVWGGICGQHRTDLIVTDGNLTAHHYFDMVDILIIEICSLWSNLFTFIMSGSI